MRGWAYTNLFWLFGRWWDADDSAYGILYRDKMANLSNLQVPRISVGESYTKIFEDLDDAIANMPDFTTSRYLSRQMAHGDESENIALPGCDEGEYPRSERCFDVG